MNLVIGSTFSKCLGSTYFQGPSPAPGPHYKVPRLWDDFWYNRSDNVCNSFKTSHEWIKSKLTENKTNGAKLK